MSGENHYFYGKTHTPETIALKSEAKSAENRPFFGKRHLAGTIALLSEANKGKTHFTATISKIRISRGGDSIYIYDTQGLLVNSFNSARNAAEYFNCSHPTIMGYVRDNKFFQNKWYSPYSEGFTISENKGSSDSEE